MIKSKLHEKSSRSNVKPTEKTLAAHDEKRLNRAYGNWISRTLAGYRSSDPAERCSSLDEYMTCNAYFLSCTFDRSRMGRRKYNLGLPRTDTTLEMDAFHYLYVMLARAVLGSHWKNKNRASRWPLALVAMDYPEAKYGTPGQTDMSNLHWHAIVVGRSDDRSPIAAALHNPRLIDEVKMLTLADSIDVRAWDANLNPDYALKAHKKSSTTATAGLSDTRIYPNPSTPGRLGWGYLNGFNRLSGALRRINKGMRRELLNDLEYARLHGDVR